VYSRDYILRLIEQMGRTLIALRNRILQRQSDEAEALAEITAVAREAGLDLEVARKLDPASLLIWLSPFGEIDAARLWLMAELLYLTALQRSSAADAIRRADLRRATAIYERLEPDWRPSPDLACAGERLAEIQRLLQGGASEPANEIGSAEEGN
jgi:hypothetical protein